MARPNIIETEPVELADADLIAKMLRALGDATRLRIVELLIEQPLIQKQLVAEVGLSQGQVSSHLACLVWCGLISASRMGQQVEYRIGDPRVVGIVDLARAILERSGAEIALCRRVDARAEHLI
jgi:ArsR family transcriptional regulator, cadmium/lead-responsive transcriptional repressor